MAVETVALLTASGATAYLAGDLVGTTFYPYSKLDVGADGAASAVVGALPVSMASIPIATGAASSAYQSSQLVQIMRTASSFGPIGETTDASAYGSRMLGLLVDDVGSTGGSAGNAAMVRIHKPSGGIPVTLATGLASAYDAVAVGTPTAQVWKKVETSTAYAAGSPYTVWDPTSGKKIRVTSYDISTKGTVSGRVKLWFGDDAWTSYDSAYQPLFVGSFAPSATAYPGVAKTFTVPVKCETADRRLYYQCETGLGVDIVIYGYEE